jgi:CBS domain containing-hemolysin-like protein
MNPVNSTLLIISAFVAYFIVTDENVAKYIQLQLQVIQVNIQRYYLMAKLHPRNPITNWMMNRKYAKMERELRKKLKMDE